MQKINSFGVRRLRSFGQEKNLTPIKPINIFVGRNSCGKSTFLRTFPLLRQSIQANTKSPILWFGDLVDFGDFDTALNDSSEEISFDFDTELEVIPETEFWGYDSEGVSFNDAGSGGGLRLPTQISINIKRRDATQLVTRLEIKAQNSVFELIYSDNDIESARVYNTTHEDIGEEFSLKVIREQGALLPLSLRGYRQVKNKENHTIRLMLTNPLHKEVADWLTDFIADFHHASKRREKIYECVLHLPLRHGAALNDALKKAFHKDKYFLKFLDDAPPAFYDFIFMLLMARDIQDILRAADELFKNFYSGVRYQAPLRAAGERFYRHQDLRVDEVDHTGSNLPMVLSSLDERQREVLSEWIRENFGFELKLSTRGLHYELLIKEEDEEHYHNISDMGFGYSQILPVIVSIWLESVRRPDTKNPNIKTGKPFRVIVLEQPELHLHPALQFKFGLAISKIQSQDSNCHFAIETHSKHLIDAIGQSIRDNIISASKINISLFEKCPSGETQVALSGFDESGYLKNWPIGFLSPDYDY